MSSPLLLADASIARDFLPARFFVLRTPLLPFASFTAWSNGLEAPDAEGVRLDEAAERDLVRVTARLRTLVGDPVVREALFVASPSLDQAIEGWVSGAHEFTTAIAVSIALYLARMASRPTPFGLFAGCSTGVTGGTTTVLERGRLADARRHTRLDMHYLCSLAEALEGDPSVRERLTYRPNNSLYKRGGHVRYAESRVTPVTRARFHASVSVERTPQLDAALARSHGGALARDVAGAVVASLQNVQESDAAAYVDILIDNQVLVSDLTPALTGERTPARGVVDALDAVAPSLATPLANALDALVALDDEGLGVPPARYRAVAALLDALPAKPDLSRLFQVDLDVPCQRITLGDEMLDEVTRAVGVLARITPHNADEALRRFRRDFVERYGNGEVNLVEALDEEWGVGFGSDALGGEPSPLIEGLDFPAPPRSRDFRVGERESWLLDRAAAATRGDAVWRLDARDLERLAVTDAPPLPDAFAVLASLDGNGTNARLLVHSISGPSGARLLGRFAHGDPALRHGIDAHLRAEELLRPDAIFAEITHLPEGRLGNVLCRPVFRGAEITYLARSGAPLARQISVDDLFVSLPGKHAERIVLRSRGLGREVIPRLTSAHNVARSGLAIYRFLGALQGQGCRAGIAWDWGPLAGAARLPRVTCGRTVFALATWNLRADELAPVLNARTLGGRVHEVRGLRARLALPRQVAVCDHDNVLPIDLDNALGVECLARLARGRERITLTELFSTPNDLPVHGPEGRYTNEVVIPFVRARPPSATGKASPAPPAVRVPRSFAPGSEWLFVKLSTGTLTADAVLTEVVRPVIDRALASGAIDRWHFLRYVEQGWHLRVRAHGAPARLLNDVWPAMHEALAPMLDDRRVYRPELDTYQREIERYGGDEGIVSAEEIFWHDSEAALRVVERLDGDAGADVRWRLAIYGAHQLLCDLGLDLAARSTAVGRMRAYFAQEQRLDAALDRQLGARFRALRPRLERLIYRAQESDEDPLAPGLSAIEGRSIAIAPVAARLRDLESRGALTVPIAELADSYVHMWINRVLRSDHLAQELVIYDFLHRLYRTERARGPLPR